MINQNCCVRDCVTWALIVSIVAGIVTAFLRITAVIELSVVALAVALGIGVVYLALLLLTAALVRGTEYTGCLCRRVNAALIGALLTVLAAVVLLAIPFAATSIIGAIVYGILAAGFTLLLTATACTVRCLTGCSA